MEVFQAITKRALSCAHAIGMMSAGNVPRGSDYPHLLK
jgi:hypothetical protein